MIPNITKTLRLRADWFQNEDYRKGRFPAKLIRPLSVELMEAADKIETLEAENARLKQREAELVEALRKYGRHQNDEYWFCDKLRHDDNPCTCGFEDILAKGGE